MSNENMQDEDADFLAFVSELTENDDNTATDGGSDQSAMQDQDESTGTNTQGAMPGDEGTAGTAGDTSADNNGEQGKTDTDIQDTEGKGGDTATNSATGEPDGTNTSDDPLADYVPKTVVKKVRHERREAVREAAEAKREAAEAKAKLEWWERQGKEQGIEYQAPKTEITDEVIQGMKEGDPDAQAEFAEIMRNRDQISQQPSAQQEPAHQEQHWTAQLTNSDVVDTLEQWSEGAEAGNKASQQRWDIAIDVSNAVMSEPGNQSLSPDEIGAKVVELTNAKIREAAAVRIAQQTEESGGMPESLSSGSGDAGSRSPDLMGLSGADLIDAIDRM